MAHDALILHKEEASEKQVNTVIQVSELVWLSSKALGWQAEGPRFDTASALLSFRKVCGLWTLSCDFVCHN